MSKCFLYFSVMFSTVMDFLINKSYFIEQVTVNALAEVVQSVLPIYGVLLLVISEVIWNTSLNTYRN